MSSPGIRGRAGLYGIVVLNIGMGLDLMDSSYMDNVGYISRCALSCFKDKFPVHGAIQSFPKNYCEESSIILSRFLKDNGISTFKLMRGTNNNGKFHFWLEDENKVIDLTAHQFDNICEPFILVPKNEYPLTSVFSNNIHEFTSGAPWPNLENDLYPKIKRAFYSDYFNK